MTVATRHAAITRILGGLTAAGGLALAFAA